jgi:threonine dehydrogenase-like Zn-dependent dehydrogenase
MRISVLREPRQFDIIEEAVPTIADDELLIRVAACGVCTSDLDVWLGGQGQTYPRFLGHEVSGVIEQMGGDVNNGLRPGDRVAAWVTGRGYADYVAVKAEYVLSAGDLPLDEALAEPMACAVNTVEMANISLGDDVVLIGAGFMGALVQRLVMLQGPRHLIVADTRADTLERASRAGATHTVNVNEESLPDVVKRLTDGKGADVSFEVTGKQAPLLMLGDVTRMSGKLVIVGYHQGDMRQIPLGYWNWMAFQILNAHFRDVATIMRGMRIGMRLLTSGRLSLADLVTHRFPLEQIGVAFQTAYEKPAGFVKSVITMPT